MGLPRLVLEASVILMRKLRRFREPKTPPSIFVFRSNDLGDLIVTTPLFQALREALPDAYIAAGVGSWAKDILKGNPYISEIIECNAPWLNHQSGPKGLIRPLKFIFTSPEVARLREREFDIGIDVAGSTFGSMLFIGLGIPVRLGRKGYGGGYTGSTAYIDATREMSVAENAIEFAGLLKANSGDQIDSRPQLFLDPDEIEVAERAWQQIEEECGSRKPRIIIAPWAGVPSKQWPIERYAALLASLSKDANGCVIGASEDAESGERLVRGFGGWRNRCGKDNFRRSMALVSAAQLVICNASAAMHIAAAFNKPCVVILTRAFNPREHAALWEQRGVHHQMFPRSDEENVPTAEVEALARQLLNSIQD